MTRVREWMSGAVVTCTPHEPLEVCARRMVDRGVRHLVAVDADGALAGVVTDGDVFRHGTLTGERGEVWVADAADRTAADALAGAEVVCVPDDDVEYLLDAISASRQDFAVVVDTDRRPVGVFTEHDGVRLAAERLDPDLSTRELSSAPVVSVGRHEPASHAMERVRTTGVRHVVVLDGVTVHGVLSLRDLLAGGVADGQKITAGELVRPGPVHVLDDGGSLRRAAARMAQHRIGCLPVVSEGGRPVGIVTRTDVIDALAAWLRKHAAQRARPPVA